MEITWRDVFDAFKLVGFPNIFEVNEFLYKNTDYTLFCFNGKVYKVISPKNFTMKDSDTGITLT